MEGRVKEIVAFQQFPTMLAKIVSIKQSLLYRQ